MLLMLAMLHTEYLPMEYLPMEYHLHMQTEYLHTEYQQPVLLHKVGWLVGYLSQNRYNLYHKLIRMA